jgi:hypothetical protein
MTARTTAIALVTIRGRRVDPPAAGLGPAARADAPAAGLGPAARSGWTGLALRSGFTAGSGWLTGSGRAARLAAAGATPLSAGADAIAHRTDSARFWPCRG